MSGMLIVFEGPEGAGKSTQLRLLADHLRARGREVVTLREPGGTSLGDSIRRVLLDPGPDMSARAEALLFMASRAELVERQIRPALSRGAIVLLDRFFLSTYAYQGGGRGMDREEIRQANSVATGGLRPDLTLLLELAPGVGLERALTRDGSHDRMESADRAFHERVSSSFAEFGTAAWQRSHAECGPIVPVDASGSVDDVFRRVVAAVETKAPESTARA